MHTPTPSIDHIARERHADALAHLSPAVRMRLRPRARTHAVWRPWGLPLAGAFAALFALAIGVQWRHTTPPPSAGSAVTAASADHAAGTHPATAPASAGSPSASVAAGASAADDTNTPPAALASVEESPDFYRWLGDDDNPALSPL